jgi:pPIWI_RE module N-terminal domain
MATQKSYQIQEFRARLIPEQLEKERVWYLLFPFHHSLNTFLRQMEHIRGRQLPHWQKPPWRWLNKFLVALIPSLVHPFMKGFSKTKGERHLLVLDGYPRPSLEQVTLLVRIWLRRWVESSFKRELQTPEGQDAYQRLLASLASPATDWESIDAGFLIREKAHPLIYTALLSLLAGRLKGEKMLINDGWVEWHLAQEGNNRIALVSQPLLSRHVREYDGRLIEGHLSYRVDFAVHTVPDDPEPRPFVHVRIFSRRYLEKGPIKKFLFGRSSTVMVGIRKPRILTGDWPVVPTLVPIRIRGMKHLRFWDDKIIEMLDDLKQIFSPDQVRSLIDPTVLAKDPDAYWYSENESDTYFMLFAEGIKPDHALGSSFSPTEFYHVWQAIMNRSQDVLQADAPLERDSETSKPGKDGFHAPLLGPQRTAI